MTVTRVASQGAPPVGIRRLWDRQLPHYPQNGPRTAYLAITVIATITFYYELYVQGAVATQIINDLDFSFRNFVFVSVVGNLVGAFASLFAGLADRWGRANLVVIGLFVTALLIGVGLPNAGDTTTYTVLFALVSFVEGVVLVATPALIRDFSPQMGRATAMGGWTLGPVLGSLVVTLVSSNTLDSQPDWRFQFYVCGAVGFVVAVVALVGLRELSPQLRDQLMVSLRDRALIEAKAAGLDPTKALQGNWRQMLRLDVIVSATAISLFLLLYYILVGFVVVYFATVFGYTEARANSLANWYWATTALVLVTTGLLSDKLLVRKPFMILGATVGLVGGVLFARAATQPDTTFNDFALYFVLSGVGTGMAYVAWMASFTETVERHNPAATATGLAIWGWILRIVVTVSLGALTFAVPATSTLVDHGPRLEHIVAEYPEQVEVLQVVAPATLAALQADPDDQTAQVDAISAISGLPDTEVTKAITLSTQLASEIATAQAIEPATLQALMANPSDSAAAEQAVRQIADNLGVPAGEAADRLAALGAVPPADLQFLQTTGPQVQEAAARLQSVSEVPPADLAFLSEHGEDVAQAVEDNPRQWQRWWWICILGQLLFIPAVFLMTGRWSPSRARRDAEAHEKMVAAELEALERATADR